MFVYDTGRDLMVKGIIPAENMLPEVAYVKLAWALGQTTDLGKVKDIMLTPGAGEITERELYYGCKLELFLPSPGSRRCPAGAEVLFAAVAQPDPQRLGDLLLLLPGRLSYSFKAMSRWVRQA